MYQMDHVTMLQEVAAVYVGQRDTSETWGKDTAWGEMNKSRGTVTRAEVDLDDNCVSESDTFVDFL